MYPVNVLFAETSVWINMSLSYASLPLEPHNKTAKGTSQVFFPQCCFFCEYILLFLPCTKGNERVGSGKVSVCLYKKKTQQLTTTSSLRLLASRHMKHFSSDKLRKAANLPSTQFFHLCPFIFTTRSKVFKCNFIVMMLVNRSQAVPPQGSINSGPEKGALSVSFTSNAVP